MTIDITGVGTTAVREPRRSSAPKRVSDGEIETTRINATRQTATADSVTITRSAAKLQAVEQQIASLPVVDQQRVEQLRNAIQSGNYKIDPKRTAEKMLQMETALRR